MDATPSFAMRAVALIAFAGLLTGATVGAYNAILPAGLDSEPFTVTVIGQDKRVAPGTTAAVGIALSSGSSPVRLTVEDAGGLDVDAPAAVSVDGRGGAWVTLTVPEGTSPGERTVVLKATSDDGTRTARVRVKVERPTQVVQEGDTVALRYTGRVADGGVFGTNDPAVASSPLPKNLHYRPRDGAYQPLRGEAGAGAANVPGFWEALVGVGVGHSATVTLAPEQAFGNATVTERENRTETVNRTIEWPSGYDGERRFFQNIVNASTEEGDRVYLGQGSGREWPFIVTHINDTHVAIRFDAQVGDTFTHFNAWPGSSEVASINDTHVVFRVTPTTDLHEGFTWYDDWPNATRVVGVTEDEILLRHSPEVGTTYVKAPQTPQGQPTSYEVVALEPEHVVLARENTGLLAGETIVFDFTVESIVSQGE